VYAVLGFFWWKQCHITTNRVLFMTWHVWWAGCVEFSSDDESSSESMIGQCVPSGIMSTRVNMVFSTGESQVLVHSLEKGESKYTIPSHSTLFLETVFPVAPVVLVMIKVGHSPIRPERCSSWACPRFDEGWLRGRALSVWQWTK
jgi:hypothetical protein